MEEVKAFLDELPIRVKVDPCNFPSISRFSSKKAFAEEYSKRCGISSSDFEKVQGAYHPVSKSILLNPERILEKGELSERLVLYHELGHWLDMSIIGTHELFAYLRKEYANYAEDKVREHVRLINELQGFSPLTVLLAQFIETPAYLIEGYFREKYKPT